MNRYQITGIIYIHIGMNEWVKRYTWEFPHKTKRVHSARWTQAIHHSVTYCTVFSVVLRHTTQHYTCPALTALCRPKGPGGAYQRLLVYHHYIAEAWSVSVGDAMSAFTTNLHLQILEAGATSRMNAALDDTHGLRPAGSAGYSYVMAMTVS